MALGIQIAFFSLEQSCLQLKKKKKKIDRLPQIFTLLSPPFSFTLELQDHFWRTNTPYVLPSLFIVARLDI